VFDVLRGGIDSTLLVLSRSSVHDLSGEDIIVPRISPADWSK
jgi:hypothetical protein